MCSRLAAAFALHGDRFTADAFALKARHAARLLADGFDQDELNELGGQLPVTTWLSPKALDYGSPRLPWQDEVSELHDRAQSVAWDLRAVATLD